MRGSTDFRWRILKEISPSAINQAELAEMNKIAEKDEGLKDLMLKAKEFFYLKRP